MEAYGPCAMGGMRERADASGISYGMEKLGVSAKYQSIACLIVYKKPTRLRGFFNGKNEIHGGVCIR
jgi:hypothetical protein